MKQNEYEILFPVGEQIDLGHGFAARVFPPGVAHLGEFTQELQSLTRHLLSLEVPMSDAEKPGAMAAALIAEATPMILRDLGALVGRCVMCGRMDKGAFVPDSMLDITVLPHWMFARAAEKWIAIAIGSEDKTDPWVRTISSLLETLVVRVTGKKISVSEMRSRFSSWWDTTSRRSAGANNHGFPTPGGRLTSSDTGSDVRLEGASTPSS